MSVPCSDTYVQFCPIMSMWSGFQMELWLMSVQECQQSFGMTRQARFMKPGLIFSWKLFWLSVQDLAACNIDLCTAGQHTTIHWDVSCHHIKKKALLSHGPIHGLFFVLYTLHHYCFLLYVLFHISDLAFVCIFNAETLPSASSTTGDSLAYNPRASGTQWSISNVPSPMMSGSATGPSG